MPCEEIREDCAHAIREIAIATACLPAMQRRLDEVKRVVCGNGEPGKSLIVRMERLEALRAERVAITKTWKDRTWEIGKGLLLLVAGFVLGWLK